MVQAAKDKGEAPPDLVRRWKCRAWGLPPKAGGMDDQDYVEITRMDLLERVYRAVEAWRKGKADESTMKVITWLVKAGLMARK